MGPRPACHPSSQVSEPPYVAQEPDARHPLCRKCSKHKRPRATPPNERPATQAAPPVDPPLPPSGLEFDHKVVAAANALASRHRLAIIRALWGRDWVKTEHLQDAVDQWPGLFDLSVDALAKARFVETTTKKIRLTEHGARTYAALLTACGSATH